MVKTKEGESIDEAMHRFTSLPVTSSLEHRIEEPQRQPPHESLYLVLVHLPLYELLTMSAVCKSLRDAVNKDVLPWLNIIIQRPLSSRLSDEILFKVTSKANGRLRTLALVDCTKIRDDGLLRVIDENPYINKLCVPACTGLTPEGVIRAVEILCNRSHCLNILRMNGIYSITKEHLQILDFHLRKNITSGQKQEETKPSYYHRNRDLLKALRDSENQRMIDLDVCPKCDQVRMVYDCPRESCKMEMKGAMNQCRACNFCLARCGECGGCFRNVESEEAACAEILCQECWLQLPKCHYCYKPYCSQHTNRWCFSEKSGMVCELCHLKFVINQCNNVEE